LRTEMIFIEIKLPLGAGAGAGADEIALQSPVCTAQNCALDSR